MTATVTCSVCGATNPADAELCQNCHSRLQALTRPLPPENPPIRSGEAPALGGNEDPEASLPRWLREMREQARQSLREETPESEPAARPVEPAEEPDLLAGLESQAQAEDEDDTPEWVARIAGKPSATAKTERPEPLMSKYVELNDEEETAPEPPPENPKPTPAAPIKPPERDELGEWFREAASNTKPRRESPAGLPRPTETAPLRPGSEDVPSWLKGLEAEAAADPTGSNWKKDLPLPSNAPPKQATPELPDWLKKLGADSKPVEPPSNEEHLPAWLRSTKKAEGSPATPAPPPSEPDWISSLPSVGEDVSAVGKPAQAEETKPKPTATAPEAGAPAFKADALSNRDVDAIFASMQTPDWLAEATKGRTPPAQDLPPAAQEQPLIAPAELPSWVQAMRPVEPELPVAAPPPADARVEEGGPLDGLQGVLPGIPGAGAATSKPEALSERLEANEQQRTHAELLEKMLATEVTPIPMKVVPLVGSQRGLRWGITAILMVLVGAIVISGTQLFAFPSGVPTESLQAVQATDLIPAGAPVLAVFDYEPATVGEMEASASALMDHLLLLQHPRLALISTSPTGAALAERFMSTTLAERKYVLGTQYVDLGYLAGGLAGVRDFAHDPHAAVPLGQDAAQVWTSPVLQDVASLAGFAGIIVITDSAESGRVWIEQTAGLRGSAPLILVSSAQAGPMLLPYVDSGQVNGLVSGLYGAVGPEATNGGRPGFVRRYWDGYNIGLYLAAFLIALGGFWNLWRGMQDRRAEQAD